jgi:phage tail sheath protein FI
MGDPNFGIVIRTVDREPRPVIGADLSTIGIIGPAPDADANIFPLDTPVLVYSNDHNKTSKLGSVGYIGDAIEGINYQLGQGQFAARVVIVRTEAGDNADPAMRMQESIGNIIGSSLDQTGIWAFMKSGEKLGVIPRLLLAPGYTGQMANSLSKLTVGVNGAGYDPGTIVPLTFTGGGTNPNIIQARAHATVREDGTITPEDVYIDSYGAWYTAAPTVTAPAPPAGGVTPTRLTLTAEVANGANPVVAGLQPVLEAMYAHAIVESAGTSEQNDIDWRETIQSARIIPIMGGVKIFDVTFGTVARPFAPRVAGVAVRRDHEKGAPFHSWANQPIFGIVGPGREIAFTITDDANEGQRLLNANIGVMVRGDVGNDFSIASGGFVFIGTDNASEDPLWQMYNVTRGRDYIHLGVLRTYRTFLGRFNITGHTVQALLNTLRYFLRDLKADEHILGYTVSFNPDSNSPEEIRLGHLAVAFAAEEPPVLKRITVESSRYRPAIEAMVAQLEAQLNLEITA